MKPPSDCWDEERNRLYDQLDEQTERIAQLEAVVEAVRADDMLGQLSRPVLDALEAPEQKETP